MSEEFDKLFAEEGPEDNIVTGAEKYWKVLIIDDESGVHTITKLALEGFTFEGRGLRFLKAMSAKEAKEILTEESDIALALIDVVLEAEDSGLQLIKFIRQDLENKLIRIVIRTGQPGQAPEKDVIVNYDINDYKEKTELTSSKLFTTVMNSLRSYRDIVMVENSRSGLRKILDTSINIFQEKDLSQLLVEAEKKLDELLSGSSSFFQIESVCYLLRINKDVTPNEISLISQGKDIEISRDVDEIVRKVCVLGKKLIGEKLSCFPFFTKQNNIVLCINSVAALPDSVLDMIDFYCGGVMASLLNVELHNEISDLNTKLEDKVALQTKELVVKNNELTRLIEQKKNLVRVLYHDLNNALTVILGAAKISLSDKGVTEKRNRELWEKVSRSAGIQKEIMEQIRDLDSIRSGKKQLNLVPTRIHSIIEKGLFIFKESLENKKIEFISELESDDMQVLVEPVSFSNNVFNNLLSNAIKFSYENGKIRVRAWKSDKNEICLSLSDQGVGIPRNLLENIFREDKKTTRTGTMGEEGTGFGMPLVKTYMEYYQARIEVESSCENQKTGEHATTFLLYLKAA